MLERANHFIVRNRCADAVPILERLAAEIVAAAVNEMLAGCYIKEGRGAGRGLSARAMPRGRARAVRDARDLGRAYMDLGRREDAVVVWRSRSPATRRPLRCTVTSRRWSRRRGSMTKRSRRSARSATRGERQYYVREIVRLERIIGREEDAFRDALLLAGQRRGALEGDIRNVTEIFRESKNRERLVALRPMTEAGSGGSGAFRTLKTIFSSRTSATKTRESTCSARTAGSSARTRSTRFSFTWGECRSHPGTGVSRRSATT